MLEKLNSCDAKTFEESLKHKQQVTDLSLGYVNLSAINLPKFSELEVIRSFGFVSMAKAKDSTKSEVE